MTAYGKAMPVEGRRKNRPAQPPGGRRLERWCAAAGLAGWVVVGLPRLSGELVVVPHPAWWAAYIAYGGILGTALVARRSPPPTLDKILLALQFAAGLIAFTLDGGYGLSVLLLVTTAAAAALQLELRWSSFVVAGQSASVGIAHMAWGHGPTDLSPITESLVFAVYQAFAVAVIEIARRERRAQIEATALTFELAAAQQQLDESSRVAERLRIARNMHDTLGHHLTALAVHLELARHLDDQRRLEAVQLARGLTTEALAELRRLVGRLREPELDLPSALSSLISSVPGLAVHLSLDEPAARHADPASAQTVLLCVQEILTNTLRHANADNLWLLITDSRSGIELRAHDDGRGTRQLALGHGLIGMRERFRDLGGDITFTSAEGDGFRIDGTIPSQTEGSP